jgi:hypothetical protein
MIKMKLDYASGFITQGYAGGKTRVSCHDNLLVIQDEDHYYYGTKLSFGQFVTDANGYVTFTRVTPLINEDTHWTFS